jgi:SAM-dependent methyltransferase
MKKRFKTEVIARNIYRNWRLSRRLKKGDYQTSSDFGYNGNLQKEVTYIQTVLADYLAYADLPAEALQGKRILEIGPGHTLGLALRLLSLGASQVVSLDKFYSLLDVEDQRNIYRTLRKELTDQEKGFFDQAITLEHQYEINPERLRYLFGHGIDEAAPFLNPYSFDLVVSRAVLEEIHDLDAAFSVMDHLLVPGGIMVHKIDLRDYKMFSRYGMNPLTFLTIPDRIYVWMTRNTINPKRRLLNYYRDKMKELGYEVKIFITHIVGKEKELIPHKETIELDVDYNQATLDLIRQVRPKLDKQFKDLPDETLLVSGIFMVAKKPGEK